MWAPRQLRLVFLAVMILLATTLGCVAWWLLKQDRQLATQHRLEAGRLQFQFVEIDAASFVRQSAAEFVEAQQTHGHRLEIETPHAALVRADRETLQCVFWNLFENAVKYSPGCDTVWVTLSRNGPHVEVEVRDRGVGIPPSEHGRIFEKFVRGTTAKENNISGTGIGLAMARQIGDHLARADRAAINL